MENEALRAFPSTLGLPAESDVVVYDHTHEEGFAFQSWFVDGSEGLEHGFFLTSPPCPETELDLLTFRIRVGPSLVPTGDGSGRRVALERSDGDRVAVYQDPWARDEGGRALPISLDVDESDILVRVDARNANYPIVVDPLLTSLETTLVPGPLLSGTAVASAVSMGDTIAVVGHEGAAHPSLPMYWTGAAYVFRRSGSNWTHEATLRPDDANVSVRFGAGVAVGGSDIFVGSPGDRDQGSDAGAVYRFAYEGNAWVKKQKLYAPTPEIGAGFGHDLAAREDWLLVGTAPNDGYGPCYGVVFKKSGTNWASNSLLKPPTTNTNEVVCSVAIDGATAIIGHPGLQAGSFEEAGLAFVFNNVNGYFMKGPMLISDDAAMGDHFGSAVAVEGTIAVVGARDAGSTDAGRIYGYRLESGTWTLEKKVNGADPNAGLGAKLAIEDGLLLASTAVEQVSVIWPHDDWDVGTPLYAYGQPGPALSMYGTRAMVGQDVYRLTRVDGYPCLGDGQCQSGHCANGVCCNEACGTDTDCRVCSVAAGSSKDGTCVLAGASVVCRAASGDCDRAETCDGVNVGCPADTKQPAGHVCREPQGGCDAPETCSGASVDCPADAIHPAGYECRPTRGECDVADTCDGTSTACGDVVMALGHPCRPALSGCDVPESCDGEAAFCPPDAPAPRGTVCRDPAGECDTRETCDGLSRECPPDVLIPAGTVCRWNTHACDITEVCSGTEPSCPADQMAGEGDPCVGGTCYGGLCYSPGMRDNEYRGCGVRTPHASGAPWLVFFLIVLLARRRERVE